MKIIALPFAAALLLCACATQTPYKPAERDHAYGYTETRLSGDHYRVVFTGNATTPADTTRDFALLRAAELTLQNGNDWFQLVSRNTDRKTQASNLDTGPDFVVPQQSVYQRCGLLRCESVVTTSPGYIGGGLGGGTTTTTTSYTSEVEIAMGKNPMPKNAESYDARQTATSLRRMLIKP